VDPKSPAQARPERYFIRTFGCQMNVHDSEKVANLLRHEGLGEAGSLEQADLLVINTCSIRDKAEQHLYGDLGRLRAWKEARPGRVLGVGGCVAQQVGDSLLSRFRHLDFVFGPQNLRLVPTLIAAARQGERQAQTEESRGLERFELPQRHAGFEGARPGQAFLTVMEGCDMFCTFCIVPLTRGREVSRPADAILAEAEQLVSRGIREITLLGQTVNAYGRHDVRRGRTEATGTVRFAELLRRLDAIPQLDRIRYTSPHPQFFDAALIRAHGELESLCPHVHLPLQSGSDRILEAMRRRYTRAHFLGIVAALREARPDIALTTDLIVGFPGESEEDFRQTLETVEAAGFVDAYSFKYSPRPGTAAASERQDAVSPEEAQARLLELQALQRAQTLAYHRSRVGQRTVVRIDGRSKRGDQLCGRDPHHRVVNLEWAGPPQPAPGALCEVEIVEATPHSLIGRSPVRDGNLRAGPAVPIPLAHRS